jgi:hypothetical protein
MYQKKVDDPIFDEFNDAQLFWYHIQFGLDIKEQFELLRDVAEHNAMFVNPEGVQQVRDSRENTFSLDDDDFNKLLQETFGRKLPEEDKRDKVDVLEMLKQDRQLEKFSSVLNMDLDEISFTPND